MYVQTMEQALEFRRYKDTQVANQLDERGVFDYFLFQYVNAMKEKFLNSSFPVKEAQPQSVGQQVYKAEDLTKRDLQQA